MIHYLYVLRNDHHNKSSWYLSANIVTKISFLWWELLWFTFNIFQMHNTVLSILVTMLYMTSPGLTYFITGSFFKKNIYLFWLCQVLVSACGIFIAACRILCCSMWHLQLWHVDFLFAACMWDLVLRPGIEPGPPALEGRSLTHWTTREVP